MRPFNRQTYIQSIHEKNFISMNMKSPVELIWIPFYQNLFIMSPDCYISWLDARHWMNWRQTRPLRQILSFLRNNILTVWKLQTGLELRIFMRTWHYLCTNTVHLGFSALFTHTVLFTCVQCAISVRTTQFTCIKCCLCELRAT